MSYTRKDHNLRRESPNDNKGRLMEDARYWPEEYVIRWSKEHKPLPKKDRERVGAT